MLMLKSECVREINSLRAELERARQKINELQAGQAALLKHLGVVKLSTPATQAGVRFVSKDDPEAVRALENEARLQQAMFAAMPSTNPFFNPMCPGHPGRLWR